LPAHGHFSNENFFREGDLLNQETNQKSFGTALIAGFTLITAGYGLFGIRLFFI
jgi:hypothetical protein